MFEADDPLFEDGAAVGVAGKIVENVFGSSEGRLGVDDPLLPEELSEKTLELFR